MQEVGENIYFDGAHNVAGIHAFLDSVALIRPQNPILLFSMVSDKDYEKAIQLFSREGTMGTSHCDHDFRQAQFRQKTLPGYFPHFGQQAVVIEDSRKSL